MGLPATMKLCRAALVAAAAVGLANAEAWAATIADDPFTDGGVTDGADPQDARWSKNSTVITLGVVNDPAIGSNALRFSSTGTFTAAVASLPTGVTLANTGDYVDVAFKLRLESTLTSTQAVRFGLYDALGTPAVDDGGLATSTPPGSASDDKGYYAILSAQAAGGHGLREETGGLERIMSGTDFTLLAGNAAAAGVIDTAVHTAGMRVTKTATGVTVGWSFDGTGYVSANDATPQTLTFDEFAFGVTEANKAALIDDVVVTTNVPIPEPGTTSLLLGGGGALLLARRGRRAASRMD